MENFFSRYRNASILVLVLFAQVLGLAVQVKRTTETGGIRLIRLWVVDAITPLEKALVSTSQGVRNIWKNYFYLRGIRHENRDLKAEIERLRIEQVRLNEDAAQARRLQALLGFKEQFISQTLAAQVIGTSGSDLSHVIYIDKGANDGIKPDMAVITPDGIVGKVLRVYHASAQVLLINDPDSGVGAILESSRLQGIVRGTAAGETMLRYVMSDEKVAPGERVLTSGGDRIFPKGLAIGTVQQTNPGSDLFLNIRIKPAANLSRLEEVLVVTKIVENTPHVTVPSGPVRAADILAERLPRVPPKPPPAPATGAAATGAVATRPSAATTATTSKPSTAATPSTAAGQPAKPATAQSQTASTSPGVGASKPSTAPTVGVTPGTSVTKLPASKPAGTASAAAKPAAAATGTAVVKPAVGKPAANQPAAESEAGKPKQTNSEGQPPKPATQPPQPPPGEEVSR